MAADGLQGSASLAAATPTLIATAPNSGSIFNVLIANNGAATTTLTIWVSTATTAGALTNANLVTAGRTLLGYAEYEKNALCLTAGENIWVEDTAGQCAVCVRGFVG